MTITTDDVQSGVVLEYEPETDHDGFEPLRELVLSVHRCACSCPDVVVSAFIDGPCPHDGGSHSFEVVETTLEEFVEIATDAGAEVVDDPTP